MRTLQHPWDWVGHFLWFGLMAFFMTPVWAIVVCAICLEIDQWWTWHNKGWSSTDCFWDLACDLLGILVGSFLNLALSGLILR